ncbi:vacuolar membrane-associated protein iml1 [Lobulomyces angularis]|nr:vacuolar membrane-associated protein iml1 [Lobulomyces angularis]
MLLIFLFTQLLALIRSRKCTNLLENGDFDRLDEEGIEYEIYPWTSTVLYNEPQDSEIYGYYVRTENPRNQAVSLNTPGRTEIVQEVNLRSTSLYKLTFSTAGNRFCEPTKEYPVVPSETGFVSIVSIGANEHFNFTTSASWKRYTFTFKGLKGKFQLRFTSTTPVVDGPDEFNSVCGPVIDDVHDQKFSKQDLLLNPELFPYLKVGDLVQIDQNPDQQQKLILQIEKLDIAALKQFNLQLSVAQHISQQFNLQPRSDVFLHKVDPELITAEYIEFSFRDQYIGRAAMFKLKNLLIGKSVYTSQIFQHLGIKVTVKEIVLKNDSKSVQCAFINKFTKIIFRSETAKFFIFIQMSKEMFHFEEDGELFYEKCVDGFLPDLFKKWKTSGCNHIVSIMLFTRIFYSEKEGYRDAEANCIKLSRDSAGKLYHDFFRVVADWEVKVDWSTILILLRKELNSFLKDILQKNGGENSYSSEGNILEAINLAINPFDKHYVDRDLTRTGQSIVLITAGTGFFEVEKKMCRLTSQRIIDNGLALDIVSLSKPPLFTVPLFLFVSRENPRPSPRINNLEKSRKSSDPMLNSSVEKRSYGNNYMPNLSSPKLSNEKDCGIWDPLFFDDEDTVDRLFYFKPEWAEISFWCRGECVGMSRVSKVAEISGVYKGNFIPRCKMDEIQQMGVIEQVEGNNFFGIPPLDYFELRKGKIFDSPIVSEKKLKSSVENFLSHGSFVPSSASAMKNVKVGSVGSVAVSKIQEKVLENSKFEINMNSLDFDFYDEKLFYTEDRWNLFKNQKQFENLLGGLHPLKTNDTIRSVDYELLKQFHRMNAEKSSNSEILHSLPNTTYSHLSTSFSNSSALQKKVLNKLKVSPSNTNFNSMHTNTNEKLVVKSNKSSPTLGSYFDNEKNNSRIKNKFNKSDINFFIKEDINNNLSPKSSPVLIKSPRLGFGNSVFLSPTDSKDNVDEESEDEKIKDEFHDCFNADQSHHCRGFNKSMSLPSIANQNHVNPSNPEKNIIQVDFQTKRWNDVDIKSEKNSLMYWKSLLTPACLPLTTDFFPSNELLKTYEEYAYTIYPDSGNENNRVEDLLIELVSQRLSQGFQLTSLQEGSENLSNESYQIYSLSLGGHVHQLSYDLNKNVLVKRYVKKELHSLKSLNYMCSISSKMKKYEPAFFVFNFPPIANYNWNYLDNLICGYEDNMTDNLRFWRSKFLVIPMSNASYLSSNQNLLNPTNANLDEEELRICGFTKFAEQFEKAKFNTKEDEKVNKTVQSPTSLKVELTTFNPSNYVLEELNKRSKKEIPGPLKLDTARESSKSKSVSNILLKEELLSKQTYTFELLAQRMQKNSAGIDISNRRWHFKNYENSFIGREFVDWLILNFSDIDTRSDAIAFGNELLNKGFFFHMNKRLGFLDGHYFYQLSKEYLFVKKVKYNPTGWLKSLSVGGSLGSRINMRSESNSDVDTPVSPSLRSSSSGKVDSTNFMNGMGSFPFDLNIKPIALMKSLVIDMDPLKKSSRSEQAILHYSTIYNSNNCFQFTLSWLVCNPSLIQEMIQKWSREAEKFSLRIIEAPMKLEDENPFKATPIIKLSTLPPVDNDKVSNNYFLVELVKRFNFLLDMEADENFPAGAVDFSNNRPPVQFSQYVHRSGVAFIQILKNTNEFKFFFNRLLLTSSSSIRKNEIEKVNPDSIYSDFQNFCNDKNLLDEFWLSCLKKLKD